MTTMFTSIFEGENSVLPFRSIHGNNYGDQKVTMVLCHVAGEGLKLSLLSPNKRKQQLEPPEKEDNQHTGSTSKLLLAPENNTVTHRMYFAEK